MSAIIINRQSITAHQLIRDNVQQLSSASSVRRPRPFSWAMRTQLRSSISLCYFQQQQSAQEALNRTGQRDEKASAYERSRSRRHTLKHRIILNPLDEIRILLACGAKPNEPVTQGLRPLHYAVWQRYSDAVQLLLVRGADVDATDECGYSALHLAAEHGYHDLVKLLLKCGAKVDHREDTSEPFPRTTLCDEPLRLALRNHHIDVARTLLEAGANPNKRYFFGSEINLVSPLDLECIELLLAFGAYPNSRDRAGLTPLMKAVRLPQKVLAFEKWYRDAFPMIGGPADVLLGSDRHRDIAIHRQGEGRTLELGIASVLLLLSYGANVNAMADARHDFRTVLHYAILGGDLDVITLLLKQGANLDLGSDYQKPTALDLAILKGDPAIVEMFLESGANVNATSPIIGSPLHVACADNIPNRLDILNMLLERGADPNLVIRSEEGLSLRPVLAEYVASNENPSVEVVSLLLKYGARVVIKTQFRDPHGILNSLQHAADKPRLLQALLDAAESFDPCMIRRSSSLTAAQKALVMQAARTPLPLIHQARLIVRKLCGTKLTKIVTRLQLPHSLHRYLLYDFC
ncbi:PREDICTED: ankyrin-3-like isoform X2 [Ceratosolen solmsi marchali]|uniref:Ankyrin-3-like isoform X2 n=1 Tax=Ceratosolen solmsi marchali TaxID=326594 RepID=A0AAJ7DWQ1_9HYME|nr:PREDICTED: ankyrin-3-like isoform X2 [Ceratosolen solmsi marchali]